MSNFLHCFYKRKKKQVQVYWKTSTGTLIQNKPIASLSLWHSILKNTNQNQNQISNRHFNSGVKHKIENEKKGARSEKKQNKNYELMIVGKKNPKNPDPLWNAPIASLACEPRESVPFSIALWGTKSSQCAVKPSDSGATSGLQISDVKQIAWKYFFSSALRLHTLTYRSGRAALDCVSG